MTDEELAHYSRALDEIWHLRRALAYEAQVAHAHLGYKTFPKTRRPIVEVQEERMRMAARGQVQLAYATRHRCNLDNALKDAGAALTLTRWEWESPERDQPSS